MLHVVEIRFAGETFRDAISRVQRWLGDQDVRPTTFRYWLYEPDSVLRTLTRAREAITLSRNVSARDGRAIWPTL